MIPQYTNGYGSLPDDEEKDYLAGSLRMLLIYVCTKFYYLKPLLQKILVPPNLKLGSILFHEFVFGHRIQLVRHRIRPVQLLRGLQLTIEKGA